VRFLAKGASALSASDYAPELACEDVPLFVDLLKTTGKTVNNETLAKGLRP
jgi:hypothetical protein